MATSLYYTAVHIIGQERLVEFWKRHPDARSRLQTWYYDVKSANWSRPADIKAVYRNASILANNRVVFNIKGNHYRLVVLVEYANKRVRIRFVGTHEEYDRINAAEI
jgi:mRNA interferase HigB